MRTIPYPSVLWLACAVGLLPACRPSAEKAGESILENAIEKSGGGMAHVDIERGHITMEGDSLHAEISTEARTWPGDIPAEVPRFSDGTVAHTTYADVGTSRTWGVFFEGVPLSAAGTYEQELKQKGYETFRFTSDEGANVSGQKGNLSVSATFTAGNAHVAIHEELVSGDTGDDR